MFYFQKIILMVCMVVIVQNSYTQPVITNYSKENNDLTSNEVTTTLVDSKGIVWIGTNRGLNAYTGSGWQSIGGIENQSTGKTDLLEEVVAIYEDKSANIWVSTEKGLFYYNREYWIKFITKGEEEFAVKQFYEDREGRLWTLQENYQDLTEELGIVIISGTIQMFDGNDWYQLNEFVSGTSWARYLPAGSNYFKTILEDKKGDIWLSSLDGLFRLEGNTWYEYTEDDIKCRKTYSIVEDEKGSIWVGTANGVSKFNNNKWTNYDKSEGLLNPVIHKLKLDASGRIWAFTDSDVNSSGVNMFDGDQWVAFPEKKIHLKGNIEDVLPLDDEVLIWTNKGISSFKSGKWAAFNRNSGLTDIKYQMLKKDRFGRVWLVGEKSVYLKNGQKWDVLLQTTAEWNLEKIFVDHAGLCWIATDKDGVYRQKTDGTWVHLTESSGLASNNTRNIFEDSNNNTWIITKKGVSRITE
jgi:ligand-binding sensor domain-containing protein